MNTPPVSSTAKELPIASPVRRMLAIWPLSGSTVPTRPFTVTNQSRPDQSGSAETMPSPTATTPERSYMRTSSKPGPGVPSVSPTTQICRSFVGVTTRSSWSR